MKHLNFVSLYLFSILIRPFFKINENLLLYSARGGVGFEGNAKYLFLYSNRHTKYINIWIAKSRKLVEEINNLGYTAVYYFTWEALVLSMQARAIFITHSLTDVMPVFYKKKTIVIDLWHGIPIKKISFLDKNLGLKSRIMDILKSYRVDYMISNSIEFQSIYIKSFKLNKNKIKNFGLPNIEYLRSPEKFGNHVDSVFPKDKLIILYAPTFRNYSFSNPLFSYDTLIWLDNKMKEINSIFYIKLHPSQKNPLIDQFKNIIIIDSQTDIYSLLFFVDHMISDYSSVFLDFIAAYPSRKVSLYVPDIEMYKLERDFNFDFNEKFRNLICKNVNEIFNKQSESTNNLKEFINPSYESCKKIINLI